MNFNGQGPQNQGGYNFHKVNNNHNQQRQGQQQNTDVAGPSGLSQNLKSGNNKFNFRHQDSPKTNTQMSMVDEDDTLTNNQETVIIKELNTSVEQAEFLYPDLILRRFGVWWFLEGYPRNYVENNYFILCMHMANCVREFNTNCLVSNSTDKLVQNRKFHLFKILAGAILFVTSDKYERDWLIKEVDIKRKYAVLSNNFIACRYGSKIHKKSELRNIFIMSNNLINISRWKDIFANKNLAYLKYASTKDDWSTVETASGKVNGGKRGPNWMSRYIHIPAETADEIYRVSEGEIEIKNSDFQFTLSAFDKHEIVLTGLFNQTIEKFAEIFNCDVGDVKAGVEMLVFTAACEQTLMWGVRKDDVPTEELETQLRKDSIEEALKFIDVTSELY